MELDQNWAIWVFLDLDHFLIRLLAILAAKAPAPIPLSMFTTDRPKVQLCNIDANAATPFSPYPYPTDDGTPMTGISTRDETTDARAPSIPATTIIASTSSII